MSITDELRKWASTKVPYKYGHQISEIADRIDTKHERGMEERADRYSELRAKMNNCYVELPKDADGEPIHIGDVMEDGLDQAFTPKKVKMLMLEDDEWMLNFGGGWSVMKHHEWRHHHAPTVEDVLREMLDKWGEMPSNMTEVEKVSDTDEQNERLGKGYPYTLRPELHKALKARGVDYWVAQGLTFWNCLDGRECVAYGYQSNGKPRLAIKVVGFTDPEQVIAATLGSGTCQQEEGGWSTEGDHARVWLTCGHDCMVETVADLPNFCPVCGAKVVDA